MNKKKGKIFINALTHEKGYRILFTGMIGFILLLNLVLYIWYRISISSVEMENVGKQAHMLLVFVVAMCSAVMIIFFVIIYFQFRNTTVLIGPKGIAYLSLLRKIRAEWNNVDDILIKESPQGRTMNIGTRLGSFTLGPQFVDRDEEIPRFKFVHKKLMEIKDTEDEPVPVDLEKSDIYKTLQQFAKEKFKN
ncbi:MAG: hypothetical protein JW737_01100 [Acidobacteria bacterium]|nr:hypothetical protein [Acidobacteriota bacterium]